MAKKNATKTAPKATKKTAVKTATKTAPVKTAPKGKGAKTAPKTAVKTAPETNGPTARNTKKGEAIALLQKGVSLETLMEKFGWQRHTVRGFISVLGKTEKIQSTSVDGKRTYQIV